MRGRGPGERDDHRATLTTGARAGRALPQAAAALAALTLATTFLPWAASGERNRSSYELVDVADRAGVLEGSAAELAWIWFLVPVLAGGVLLALALDRLVTVGALSSTLGAMTVIGGVMVTRSPLVVQTGAYAAIVTGGVTAFVGAVTVHLQRAKART